MKRHLGKMLALWLVMAVIIAADQYTKVLVAKNLRMGETIPIVGGFFDLTYLRNTGAAFGMLARWAPEYRIPFFLVIPVLALVLIGVLFRKTAAKSFTLAFGLSLLSGGAIGNLIDRLRLGSVVDFLLFHWHYRYQFPAFNVADSAITVGVGILLLDLLRQEHQKDDASR